MARFLAGNHMIIVDRALEARADADDPIQVGLVGAGALGRGVARQFITAATGQRLAGVANRTLERGAEAWTSSGMEEPLVVEDVAALDAAIRARRPVVTTDPLLLCASEEIDAIVEATGTTEYGARVALAAIEHGKHVFINAELDKASEDNERNSLVIGTAQGRIGVVQIAGLVARRIVCFSKEGQAIGAGPSKRSVPALNGTD